jgi:hypothetical protein
MGNQFLTNSSVSLRGRLPRAFYFCHERFFSSHLKVFQQKKSVGPLFAEKLVLGTEPSDFSAMLLSQVVLAGFEPD